MQKRKQLILFPIYFMLCFLLASCGGDSSKETQPDDSMQSATGDTSEEVTTDDSIQSETGDTSEDAPLNDNIPSLSDAEEDFVLYTEDSSHSISLTLPEGFTISEFSDEAWMLLENAGDGYTLNTILVLWQKDVGDIESSMIKEAKATAVPYPDFSGNNLGDVHTITIGELTAQGFAHSYTSSKSSAQEYRIWIPFRDGTSLICVTECIKPGETLPDYTEEMVVELMQMMLGLSS